jgi:hypothetical protein
MVYTFTKRIPNTFGPIEANLQPEEVIQAIYRVCNASGNIALDPF